MKKIEHFPAGDSAPRERKTYLAERPEFGIRNSELGIRNSELDRRAPPRNEKGESKRNGRRMRSVCPLHWRRIFSRPASENIRYVCPLAESTSRRAEISHSMRLRFAVTAITIGNTISFGYIPSLRFLLCFTSLLALLHFGARCGSAV